MPEEPFDPYQKWLQISKDQRPPTLYQLLGIQRDETDAETIQEASLMRIAHVRHFQTGPQADDATRILNEVAEATEVLLDPVRRREYDRKHHERFRAESAPSKRQEKAIASPPPVAVERNQSPRQIDRPPPVPRSVSNTPNVHRMSIVIGASLLGLSLILAFAATSRLSPNVFPNLTDAPMRTSDSKAKPGAIGAKFSAPQVVSELPIENGTPETPILPLPTNRKQGEPIIPRVNREPPDGSPVSDPTTDTVPKTKRKKSRTFVSNDKRQPPVNPDSEKPTQETMPLEKPAVLPAGPRPPIAIWPFSGAEASEHQRKWAAYLDQTVVKENTIGMKLALIPPGQFVMGSPAQEKGRTLDEAQTYVELTLPFYMGVYEVTQEEFETVMREAPSYFSSGGLGYREVAGRITARYPVERAIWSSAIEFCRRLTENEQHANKLPIGWRYQLPTEAQWEWACRAGTDTATAFGDSVNIRNANFNETKKGTSIKSKPVPKPATLNRTTNVGSFAKNAFGLYDMHGNVREWCLDRAGGTLRGGIDPFVSALPRDSVIRRGGCWADDWAHCRSASRSGVEKNLQSNGDGFRVVLVPIK